MEKSWTDYKHTPKIFYYRAWIYFQNTIIHILKKHFFVIFNKVNWDHFQNNIIFHNIASTGINFQQKRMNMSFLLCRYRVDYKNYNTCKILDVHHLLFPVHPHPHNEGMTICLLECPLVQDPNRLSDKLLDMYHIK